MEPGSRTTASRWQQRRWISAGVKGSHELVGELTRPLVSTNDIEVDGTNLLLDAADGLGVVGRACGELGLELRDLLFGRLRLP